MDANELSTEDTEVKELNLITDQDIENAPRTPLKYQFSEENLDANYKKVEQVPIEVNVAVEKWLDYFTGRGRPHMERYLSRSSRYLPLMKNILKQNGLPEDLVYVALIESGFSPTAYSHASAVGYWQFIRGTGLRYDLRIDAFVDERRDFVRSTQAAAQYFKALYNLFGEWYLAIASYNVGENRIKRLVMKHQTRDFWELARRKRLPKETINYVPKYIAAKLIAKDPAKYGFANVEYQPELAFQEIEIDKPLHLENYAKAIGMTYEDLFKLNPMYRGKLAPPGKNGKATIKLPLNFNATQALQIAEGHMITDQQEIAKMMQPDYIRYKVRNGDTLGAIARRFRTRVSTIKELNRISGNTIRAGSYLRIPSREGYKGGQVAANSNRSIASTKKVKTQVSVLPKAKFHRVKRGENLSMIAAKYNVPVNALRTVNKVKGNTLFVGKNLKIPVAGSGRVAGNAKHVVRPGETLIDIARKYKISLSQIASANQLSNKSYIQIGKELVIPQ
jgi:membrane-bound lytic murein transglycosylase D